MSGHLKKRHSGFRRAAATAGVVLLSLWLPVAETAHAGFGFHKGFRGGFHRGFGHGFHGSKFGGFHRGFHRSGFRGVSSFHRPRFSTFHRSGFRGVRGFGRSRFNSLAFRSRRFGGFGPSFSRFGHRGGFVGFRPGFHSFAFSRFPSRHFVSRGFASHGFRSRGLARPVIVSSPVILGGPAVIPSAGLVSAKPCIGWNHLSTGHIADARSAFLKDIAANQSVGSARLGFALASAQQGDLDRGVWAMRRAFKTDRGSLSQVVLDDSLRPMVEKVTRQYEDRMETTGKNDEDMFMLAALYQLQGDPEMAAMAIHSTSPETVQLESTKHLTEMIDSEMKSMPMTSSKGWDLLAGDDPNQAFSEFVNEIGTDPGAGEPKLGYALAAAELGMMDRSVWAARRAFDADHEAVSDIMLSGKLRPVVERTLTRFQQQSDSIGMNKDNAFMIAMLFQLLGDTEGAQSVVQKEMMDKDDYMVTLVNEEMDAQVNMLKMAMEHPEMADWTEEGADGNEVVTGKADTDADSPSTLTSVPEVDAVTSSTEPAPARSIPTVARSAPVQMAAPRAESYIVTLPCGTRVRVIEQPVVRPPSDTASVARPELHQYDAPLMEQPQPSEEPSVSPKVESLPPPPAPAEPDAGPTQYQTVPAPDNTSEI